MKCIIITNIYIPQCDPGISDMSGQTPLHRAVMVQRCGDCVQAIVTMAVSVCV